MKIMMKKKKKWWDKPLTTKYKKFSRWMFAYWMNKNPQGVKMLSKYVIRDKKLLRPSYPHTLMHHRSVCSRTFVYEINPGKARKRKQPRLSRSIENPSQYLHIRNIKWVSYLQKRTSTSTRSGYFHFIRHPRYYRLFAACSTVIRIMTSRANVKSPCLSS